MAAALGAAVARRLLVGKHSARLVLLFHIATKYKVPSCLLQIIRYVHQNPFFTQDTIFLLNLLALGNICMPCQSKYQIRNHSFITSAIGLGGWVQKIAIFLMFSNAFMYVDTVDGWV